MTGDPQECTLFSCSHQGLEDQCDGSSIIHNSHEKSDPDTCDCADTAVAAIHQSILAKINEIEQSFDELYGASGFGIRYYTLKGDDVKAIDPTVSSLATRAFLAEEAASWMWSGIGGET